MILFPLKALWVAFLFVSWAVLEIICGREKFFILLAALFILWRFIK